jgi:hypothetical protein
MIRYFKAIIPCILVHGFVLFSLPAIGALDCDFDADMDADGSDLAQFALWYAEGDPAADVTDDGDVDEQDVARCSAEFGMIEGDTIKPTVLVTNLKDKSVVKTGFITGTAGDNEQVTGVEVKLDSGNFAAAVGTTSWKFKLPTSTNTWKDGSHHTFSVRARDGSGNYSDVVAMTVRKGKNKDINGDGYGDLAVGAPSDESYGRVYVFQGGSAGVSTLADTTITGEPPGYAFGEALSLGDVNSDGYADLAIGDYGYDSSHGRVWIFHGSAAGIPDADLSAGDHADTTLDGEGGTSTNFGSYMGFGDVNGDGYADLAVGAPGWYGKIHIFHGSSSGIPDTDLSTGQVSDTTIVAQNGGDFGESVNFGDIDGDGYGDLAVGAKGYNSRQGRTYIFYGSAAGIADTNLRAGDSADTALTGITGNYGFGYRTAFGDVNGDGFLDLTISAANNWEQGYVYVFHGDSSGIPDTDLSAGGTADTVITGVNARNNFGYAIGAGDIDADGYDDIAVGARLYNLNQGRVFVFHSTASGIPHTDLNTEPADTVLTGESGDSLFGDVALVDDFNGDSAVDLAVGASFWGSWSGRVYVFHNSGSGIPDVDLSAGDTADTTLTGAASSFFGAMLGE